MSIPFIDTPQRLEALPLITSKPPRPAGSPTGAPGASREQLAFWCELVLDGLHQSVKLARHDLDSTVSYKELLKFQLVKPPRRGPRRGTGEYN